MHTAILLTYASLLYNVNKYKIMIKKDVLLRNPDILQRCAMAYFSNPMEKLDFNLNLGGMNIRIVNINKVEPRPDWYVPEHEHSDFEIHMIPEGRGYINIEGQDFIVEGGEFYITGPLVKHKQQTDCENAMKEYCLEFEINIVGSNTSADSSLYDESVFLKETLSKIYPYSFRDTMGLTAAFEEIFEELRQQNPCFILRIQALLLKMIMDILRTVCSNEKIAYQYPVTANSIEANRIQRIIKYIDANYKNHITIDDVSKVILLSPKQINRLMKKTFNQTFHRYLHVYRLHKAEKLLSNSSLSIEEVAYESGFSSHFYMYQAFKRKGNQPPGHFRT